MYHDFDGCKIEGNSVALDYCHNEGEMLGFADQFSVDGEGLHLAGSLLPAPDGCDRASEVIRLSDGGRGVPYQMSIDFRGDDLVVEEVEEGQTAEVNGQTITGPALIFREWPLRGVAICPYGKDRHTSAQFSADDDELVVLTLSEGSMVKKGITGKSKSPAKGSRQLSQGTKSKPAPKKPAPKRQLSDDKPDEQQDEEDEQQEEDSDDEKVDDAGQDDDKSDAKPEDGEDDTLDDDDEQQDEEQQDEEEKPAQQQSAGKGNDEYAARLQKFMKRFGAGRGAKWFAEGKSWSECVDLESQRLRKDLETSKRQLAVRDERLRQLGEQGEDEPLSLSEEPAPKGKSKGSAAAAGDRYSSTLGPKLGTYAASLKLPK